MIVYTVIYVVILYYMACSFTAAQTLTPGKWLYHIITTVYIYIYIYDRIYGHIRCNYMVCSVTQTLTPETRLAQ